MIKYKKIINLLGNSLNQPFKFRTRKIFCKKMMNHVERIAPILTLNLRLEC